VLDEDLADISHPKPQRRKRASVGSET